MKNLKKVVHQLQRKRKTPINRRKIATVDFETDPFLFGRVPKPFCAGFYSREIGFKYFWGFDCVLQLAIFCESLEDEHIIYAHNGGKFDAYFLMDYLENPIKVIGSRIAVVKFGKHELRDSYSILPIPLRAYIKDEIDYRKLEADVRENHKEEIISYLKTDCVSLYDIVSKFIERFGVQLTIGGTAIKELKKLHPFQPMNRTHDDRYRPYYFGGRVECFKTGILDGKWQVYDVNSMYPHVMKNFHHPTGGKYISGYNRIIDKKGKIAGFVDAKFYFARIECNQSGAFPTRIKDQPLNFDIPFGEFLVTSHELEAAIETGRAWNIKVKEIRAPVKTIQFGEYVDIHTLEKILAKKDGNKADEIFAKLLLNSAYGKFGQSPDGYWDYWVGIPPDDVIAKYEIYSTGAGQLSIWRTPSENETFYDVATAASITGASRAVLMRALAKAKNPVYCDTDSIICEALDVHKDESALGAWKLEAEGSRIALVGKKMYALEDENGNVVKKASKGVILTGHEIFSLCNGNDIAWHNQAPSFSLQKNTKFIERTVHGLKN